MAQIFTLRPLAVGMAVSLIIIALLPGCTLSGSPSLDTAEKRALAFCGSFESTLEKLTILKAAGRLSDIAIRRIDDAVTSIEPFCTASKPGDVDESLIQALDILLTLQLAREAD